MLSPALLHQRDLTGRSQRAPFIREEILLAVAMLCKKMQTCRALLTLAQCVMRHADRCMVPTCFGDWPGKTHQLEGAGHACPCHHVVHGFQAPWSGTRVGAKKVCKAAVSEVHAAGGISQGKRKMGEL